MDTILLWRWQVKQPCGRWRVLAWRMTEELAHAWAQREGREVRKLPDSAERRAPAVQLGGMMDRLGTPY